MKFRLCNSVHEKSNSSISFGISCFSEKMLMTGEQDLFIKKDFLNLKSAQFNLELDFKLFKNITGE